MLNEGDRIPDVTLQLPDGSLTPVSAWQGGSPAVIYFYPKDDTSGCTAEAQAFTADADAFAAIGVKIIGISKDPPKKHLAFIAKYGLAVELATDADDTVCEGFGTWIEKSMYGRKYMGIARATFLVGGDGTVLKAWHKVKVPGHSAEVLAAAQAVAV
jgi:peroxiredoxin Q/BCP